MALIGIDLGTTNSLLTAYKDDEIILIPNKFGNYMTKSAVSFLEDGKIIVGDAARERLVSHPENTVAYFKQHMGTEHEYTPLDKNLQAHDLSALILKQLKSDAEEYLGEEVTEVIISVPAYFNDNQRNATKLAASLAGLQANRLINEPSAAALYHRFEKKINEGKLLVIDFGGGTFDVSVVDCFEEMVEILSISGDNKLGGKDIDKAIVEHYFDKTSKVEADLTAEELASLYRHAEQAKIVLSYSKMAWYGTSNELIPLNDEVLAKICAPLFRRVKDVIISAVNLSKISIKEITDIVLVGGSSHMRVFSDYLEDLFGVRPFAPSNAENMVALGLGLCCGIKNKQVKDVFMTDVCPFSLGVGIYNSRNPQRNIMSILISRCSVLPCSVTHTYTTVYDGQSTVNCTICQGENMYEDENLKLGEIGIQVPPAPAGRSWIKLTFTYTIDGILQIKLLSCDGTKQEKLILNPNISLNESEIKEKLAELSKLEYLNPGGEIDQLIFATLERLYFETNDDNRFIIQSLYNQLATSIIDNDQREHRLVRERIQSDIKALEGKLIPSLRFDDYDEDGDERRFN